jgi:hypothetical protein
MLCASELVALVRVAGRHSVKARLRLRQSRARL